MELPLSELPLSELPLSELPPSELPLPVDIWRLILEALTTDGDPEDLLHAALTCRTSAHFALPLLYEHYSEGGVRKRGRSGEPISRQAMWWRSVVMSTLGATREPYYAFVTMLDPDNLTRRLDQIASCSSCSLRREFFSPPLEMLEIKHGEGLDVKAIVSRVAKMLTDRIEEVAAMKDGGVLRLQSLTVDGEFALTSDIAVAIRKTCPRLKKLNIGRGYCWHWSDWFMSGTEFEPEADKELGDFIHHLKPNSLVSLKTEAGQHLGPETLQGLRDHKMSLRHLHIHRTLQKVGLESLPLVGPLVNLTTLALGCPWESPHAEFHRQSPTYERVVTWVQQMTSLKDLSLSMLPSMTNLVLDVLQGSDIELTSLRLVYDHDGIYEYMSANDVHEDQIRLYGEIAKQTKLQNLDIQVDLYLSQPHTETHPLHQGFSHALMQLSQLRRLLVSTPIFYNAFVKFAAACPHIEELTMSPHHVEETAKSEEHLLPWLETLKGLRSLKYLQWDTKTTFTTETLLDFFRDLADDPLGCHQGFTLSLQAQMQWVKFGITEKKLIRRMAERLDGDFQVYYRPS